MARPAAATAAATRTGLGRLREEELALEVRAANASTAAPVQAAREADLNRQIEEMLLEQNELEAKRQILQSGGAEAEEEAAGTGGEPDAAAVAAMEAELKAPLTPHQHELIQSAKADGPQGEVIASGTFTGQGMLEVTRKDVKTMNTGRDSSTHCLLIEYPVHDRRPLHSTPLHFTPLHSFVFVYL